jgi:hypothetical protein
MRSVKQSRPRPSPTTTAARPAAGRALVASEWDTFMAPEERPEISASTPGGAPKGGAADEVVVPELIVILEALLDVRDIVLSDGDEVSHLRSALARVDRDTSIATWPRAEPPAMTEWRQGVLRRAARSEVAAAILHALEPYHALIRRADASRPVVVLHLPADRVTAVRQRAVMSAWCEQMEHMVARDAVELGEWLRYCIAAHSSAGTQEDVIAWEQGVIRRAEADSEAAARVLESIRQRDQAMAALAADAARPAVFVVHVPGVAP